MKNFDGRRISHKKREEIRIVAIRRVEAGESPEKVIKALGFHRSCIYQWMAKYRKGGYNALRAKKISGRSAKINDHQRKLIYDIIISKNPLQFEFESAFWTRKIIKKLILDMFGTSISLNSVDRLLKKIQLNDEMFQFIKRRIKRRQKMQYPEIRMLARYENAVIYYCLESKIDSSLTELLAFTSKGPLRFMIIRGRLNAVKYISFLKCLMNETNRQIYLVVYKNPINETATVQKFIKSTKNRLGLFFLHV